MLMLAFDTSSRTASVAILQEERVFYEININKGLNHSEVLLPAIEEAFRFSGITVRDIDLFACTLGPGSFTGLRIGLSTLKGLMMATGKPAVGVSSLAALALNVEPTEKIIAAVMDAGRGQVYMGHFRYGQDGILNLLDSEKAVDPQQMVDVHPSNVIYVGEGAVKYETVLRSFLSNQNSIASEEQQYICASAVGRLAFQKFKKNELLDLVKAVPVYLRSSDAVPKNSTF